MFAAKNELLTRPSGGYRISRSLRFRSSASAYLNRTPASAGNRKTWTWSGWVKRGALSSNQVIFACGSSYTTNTYFTFYFGSDNTLVTSTGTAEIWRTTAAYRDPSAFYHLVLVVDTNNATANNRTRLWVNGSEVTNFTRGTNLSLSTDYGVNDTVIHYLGRDFSGVYLDGYLAEVNFLDGYPTVGGTTYDATTWAALNVATLFGAYDTNGVWQPKAYTGTYGTNGFYLKYADPSGLDNGNDTYTKLLLHGNGLNDSAWNGSSNHALTAYGSATTSTTQTKFGMGSSLYTVGASSQYFRTDASADFKYAATSGSTNDFTFDFWFYPGASGSAYPYICIADTTYSSLLFYGQNIFASSNNSSWDIAQNYIGVPTAGQWNHYALVRSGSTWRTFLNGVQIDTWTNSSAGYDYTTNNYLQIGRVQGGAAYSTGYYTEVRWSAGIARWTSAFTPPTVPYSGGAGTDSSGSVNAWRPFNINSTSSGTTYDSMIDSPTNYADGGNGRGNYAVLNPNFQGSSSYISRGNLYATGTNPFARATMSVPATGQYYYEVYITAAAAGGYLYGGSGALYKQDGTRWNGSGWLAYGASYTAGNTIGCAVDTTNNTVTWYKDNVSQGQITTNVGLIRDGVSDIWGFDGSGAWTLDFNFGQRPFAYTPPSGFSALNTQNLPTPTIAAGNKHFDATTYMGDGAASGRNISLNFSPDLMWIKSRSLTTGYHFLFDNVRGATKVLGSSQTSAEYTNGDLGLGTNQFTVGDNAGLDEYNPNKNTATYVAWLWKANGSGSSNTSGSITSTVSANVTAGFSVVTYTGTGANATVGHGLGVAPGFIIVKRRTGAPFSWPVYNSGFSGGANDYLILDGTQAKASNIVVWNNTNPTSSVFSIGTDAFINGFGAPYVAYCFAPVAGYSAFGGFTANGVSGDGSFIYTGFLPRFILYKRTDSTSSWFIHDTSRQGYNVQGPELYPDISAVEATATRLDILSNGFKIRAAAATNPNVSSATYIYACFASNPFKTSRAF